MKQYCYIRFGMHHVFINPCVFVCLVTLMSLKQDHLSEDSWVWYFGEEEDGHGAEGWRGQSHSLRPQHDPFLCHDVLCVGHHNGALLLRQVKMPRHPHRNKTVQKYTKTTEIKVHSVISPHSKAVLKWIVILRNTFKIIISAMVTVTTL